MPLYVVEIDGRPVLAFPEESLELAEQEARDGDISEALQEFQIDGSPVWNGEAPLSIREAGADEAREFEDGFAEAVQAGEVAEDERDEFAVFLVDADEME